MANPVESLDEILAQFLGNRKILDVQCKQLTETGDNYGSDMSAVTLKLRNGEEIEVVIKVPPPGKLMKELFNSPVTFRNEVKFYTLILPELQDFVGGKLNEKLDFFAQCYGARLSLDPDKELADDDAILLLENLKTSGYRCVDRFVSYDMATSRLILEKFAVFHASTLALRRLEPARFDKFAQCFSHYRIFYLDKSKRAQHVNGLVRIVESLDSVAQFAPRVRNTLQLSRGHDTLPKNTKEFLKEPWTCMVHCDAWINNIMVKFVGERPESCKLIDWQLFELGSPARDVIFFIYTSIRPAIVEQHYDELVKVYHDKFIEVLQRFDVKDIRSFGLEAFHEEIKRVVELFEFFHLVTMVEPIFKPKEKAKTLDEYTEHDFGNQQGWDEEQKARIAFIVKEFVKLNFI